MSYKILLADDSVTVQKIVTLTFSDEGVDVVPVNNGTEAITRLRYMRPALVMADVSLPGRNGFEICEFVKSHPDLKNTPVILLVPAFEPFDHERAIRVGADHHLTKPFQSIRALIATVRRLIEEPKSANPEPLQWPTTTPPTPEAVSQAAPRITADAQVEAAPSVDPFSQPSGVRPALVAPLPQPPVIAVSASLDNDELLELTGTDPDTGDLVANADTLEAHSADPLQEVLTTAPPRLTDLVAPLPGAAASAQPGWAEQALEAAASGPAVTPTEAKPFVAPPPIVEMFPAPTAAPAEPSLKNAVTNPVDATATVVVLPVQTGNLAGNLASTSVSYWDANDFDDLLELDDVLPPSTSQPLTLTMLPAPLPASGTTTMMPVPLPNVESSITQSLRVTAVEAITTVPQNIIDEIVSRVTAQVSTQLSSYFQQFATQMAQDLAPRIAQEVLAQINSSKPNSLPAKD